MRGIKATQATPASMQGMMGRCVAQQSGRPGRRAPVPRKPLSIVTGMGSAILDRFRYRKPSAECSPGSAMSIMARGVSAVIFGGRRGAELMAGATCTPEAGRPVPGSPHLHPTVQTTAETVHYTHASPLPPACKPYSACWCTIPAPSFWHILKIEQETANHHHCFSSA